MATGPDARATLEHFWAALRKHAETQDYVLYRRSDHDGVLRRDDKEIPLYVKLSQSGTGFWGLTKEKFDDLATSPGVQLLLLTGAFSGYLINSGALGRLASNFSRTQEGEYRINEGKVIKQPNFRIIPGLWRLLVPQT